MNTRRGFMNTRRGFMNTINKITFNDAVIFIDCIKNNQNYITSMVIPISTINTNYKSKYSYLENIDIVSFILFCLDDYRNNKEAFLKELSKMTIEYFDSSIVIKYGENTLTIERHTDSVLNIVQCKYTMTFYGSDRIYV